MYGKTGGIVAYHAYISFKPGEVTPEEAQQVAMEVANKMWGADYEMVVATHMNANCIHCHIVINSVSMTDGRKMNEDRANKGKDNSRQSTCNFMFPFFPIQL